MDTLKSNLLTALRKFAAQRAGLHYADYHDGRNRAAGIKMYRAEAREITRQLHDARTLLSAIEQSGMPGEALKAAFTRRLTVSVDATGNVALDYAAGQYFAVEYRAAVCGVASLALWDYYRDAYAASAKQGESLGDAIRRNFKREFGARIQKLYFE